MSDKESKKKIFSKFKATSKNDWVEEMKNNALDKQADDLIWHTSPGFSIDAFYTAKELTLIAYLADFQVHAEGGLKQSKRWEYRESVFVKPGCLEKANNEAISKLASGAEGIIFDLNALPIHEFEPTLLLQEINLTEKSLSFQCEEITEVLEKLVEYLTKQNISGSDIHGAFYTDPIAHWSLTGMAYEKGLEALIHCVRNGNEFPELRYMSVRSDHFHAAGANVVQQLAFAMNVAVTYLDRFTEEGIDIKQIASKMTFSVAVGSSYFMEIAKLRALKILFAKVVQVYGEKEYLPTHVRIHATSASITKAIKEPYTNMVRNTAEAMSAILGGCSSFTLLPFDLAYENSGDFAQRISRNVSLLLREEAHFEKVSDPVAGSYYIAHLTDQLIEHAWNLFLKVEALGGYTKAFKAGFIQEEIARSAREKISNIKKGEEVWVGVNKYQSGETYAELGKTKPGNTANSEKHEFPLLIPLQIEIE
jgi:methylmalonyl-CoA mutase